MREQYVREYTYSRRYKFVFIWLSNVLLVLLTLAVVYGELYLVALNFLAWTCNYYFLANSFNKKIFVHNEGKFVYRNVFRRRVSFNIEDILEVKATTIRKGLMLKLNDGKGFIYLTPYWRNWRQLFRFVVSRVEPEKIKDKQKVSSLIDQ